MLSRLGASFVELIISISSSNRIQTTKHQRRRSLTTTFNQNTFSNILLYIISRTLIRLQRKKWIVCVHISGVWHPFKRIKWIITVASQSPIKGCLKVIWLLHLLLLWLNVDVSSFNTTYIYILYICFAFISSLVATMLLCGVCRLINVSLKHVYVSLWLCVNVLFQNHWLCMASFSTINLD